MNVSTYVRTHIRTEGRTFICTYPRMENRKTICPWDHPMRGGGGGGGGHKKHLYWSYVQPCFPVTLKMLHHQNITYMVII